MCFTLLSFYCIFHAISALCFYSISQVKGSIHFRNVNEDEEYHQDWQNPLLCNYSDNFKLSFNYRVVPFCSCKKPVLCKGCQAGAGPDSFIPAAPLAGAG